MRTKQKIEDLENRIDGIRKEIDELTDKTKIVVIGRPVDLLLPNPYHYEPSYHYIGIQDVVQQLLNHLGLDVKYVHATSSSCKLVPKPNKEKKK